MQSDWLVLLCAELIVRSEYPVCPSNCSLAIVTH